MNTIKELLSSKAYEWIFSGIGVAAICGLITIFGLFFKFRRRKHIHISTKGDKSPGIVGRDYNVGKK